MTTKIRLKKGTNKKAAWSKRHAEQGVKLFQEYNLTL